MGDARGYSWAPFRPGHTLSTRHGAYSPRKVDPLAAELVERTAPTVTWWQQCDMPAVWAWARVEARIQLVTEYLAEVGGDLTDDGEVRAAADLLTRLESQAMNHRARIGLDPLSRARLGRDVAATQVDLARMWAVEDLADDSGPEIDVQPSLDGNEDT
jgi:hypothetical protein